LTGWASHRKRWGCLVLPDEREYRALADEIQRQRPGWLVMWGAYSRRYTAYPLFPVRRRVIIIASYPQALIERMNEAERALRMPGTRD
jgi:hypothetical protein